MTLLWCALIVFRVALTCCPQNGYIHPDEFFQSSEVVAGDILQLEVLRPWELNSSFPLRSMVLPYLTCAPPFLLIRFLTQQQHVLPSDVIYPYLILVLPRMVLVILSVINDVLLYQTGKLFGLRSRHNLWMCAASYVSLVYYTRTLSNSLEAFLFTALLYVISKQWKTLISQGSKDKKCSENTALVALLLVGGIFNRPTFVVFAVIPCLTWLLSGVAKHTLLCLIKHTIKKLLSLGLYGVILSLVFVICDSLYFETMTFKELSAYKTFLDSPFQLLTKLTLTPLNFVKYNSQSENLASHGLHSKFQHLLVNTPLLFNILALYVCIDALKFIWRIFRQDKNSKWPFSKKSDCFLLGSYFVPIFLLSIFPHQEPRFLVPLLGPLLLYYRNMWYMRWGRLTVGVWLIGNILCAGFYGGFHQAGLVPALQYCHQISHTTPHHHHLIFHQTYMPPRHLLGINVDHDLSKRTRISKSKPTIHDLKGATNTELINFITHLSKIMNVHSEITLVSPATVLQKCHLKTKQNEITLELKSSYFPHVSTENLPEIDSVFCWKNMQIGCDEMCKEMSFVRRLKLLFSLNVYTVIIQ